MVTTEIFMNSRNKLKLRLAMREAQEQMKFFDDREEMLIIKFQELVENIVKIDNNQAK